MALRSTLPENSAEETPEAHASREERDEEVRLKAMTFPLNRIGGFLVELWSGEDLGLHGRLREALDEAGIPYYNKPAGDYPGVRLATPIPMAQRPRFGFTLAVLESDLSAARHILERLLDEEPEEMALAASDDESGVAAEVTTHGDENATMEVWSGADAALCGFIGAALQENEIAARLKAHLRGNSLLVHPANEARAREIVREIVEGAPAE